jgi:hypothetical protein
VTTSPQKVIRRTAIVFALLPMTPAFVWLAVLVVIPALSGAVSFFVVYSYFCCWPIAIALGLVDLGMSISKRVSKISKSSNPTAK